MRVKGKKEGLSLLLSLQVEHKTNHAVTVMMNDCYCRAALLIDYRLVHIVEVTKDDVKKCAVLCLNRPNWH